MTKQAEAAKSLKRRIEALDAEGRYDDALAAFEELAALDPRDDGVRKALAESGYELAYELALTKRDRPAAEAVYARLRALRERFPEDSDAIGNLAASAAALSGVCAIEKDWQAACDYAVAINHLNRNVPEKLNRELDLLYGRAVTTTILALVQDEQWNDARRLVYTMRELLLADFMLTDLAEQKGAVIANDIKGLFEAMIDAFRDSHPELAAKLDADMAEKKGAPVEEPERRERGHVEERYDFETLKDVTIYGFLSLRVPARWPEARTEGGRGGFWEEDVESGTLWIDWNLYEMPEGARAADAARGLAQDYEGAVVEIGKDGDLGVIRLRRESFEAGQPLIIHAWHVLRALGRQMLLLHFNLVLPADLAERDDFRPLPDLIAQEIRAARIDFSRIPAGAD